MKVDLEWLETLVEDEDWKMVHQLVGIGVGDRVIADCLSEAKDIPGLECVEAAKVVYLSPVKSSEVVPSNPEWEVIAVAPLSKVYASASRPLRLEALLAVLVLVAADELSPVPVASLALDSHYALPQKRQLAQPATPETQWVFGLIGEQLRQPAAASHLRDPVYPPGGASLRQNHGVKECVLM